MPWARVADDFHSHPKTAAFCDLIGCKTGDAYLVRLWTWAMKYAPGGDLTRFSNRTIARAVGWRGDPGKLLSALVESGFVDRGTTDLQGRNEVGPTDLRGRSDGDPLVVHDWTDHSGQYETQTAKGRERKQKWRERKATAATYGDGIDDVGSTAERAQNGDVPGTSRSKEERIEVEGIEEKIINPRAKTARSTDCPEGFTEFWTSYPNKRGKQDALKAWKKLAPGPDLVAVMISAVERQKLWPDWQKDSGQFIPHPATWLNGRRWEDEEPKVIKRDLKAIFEKVTGADSPALAPEPEVRNPGAVVEARRTSNPVRP